MVLGSESRTMAQDESNRQNQLLTQEIDAHRRTDAALQAAKDLADSANQAKTRYVAGITHELRTPLNSILGYAQILLKEARLDGPRRARPDHHPRSGEHMHALVDGLLDLARIEAGRAAAGHPQRCRCANCSTTWCAWSQPQANAKGLQLRASRRTGGCPPTCGRTPKRLRQILINLLSNAVRFTDYGSVVAPGGLAPSRWCAST